MDFISLGTMWLSNRRFLVANIFCAAAPVGALEAKEQLMFSGSVVEGWACSVTEGSSHAGELECLVPKGVCSGLLKAPGQAEGFGYKTSQDAWLNQVSNKWEHLLYQTGSDWKTGPLLEDARALLVDDMEKANREKKWVSFERLSDAWGM